MRGAGWALMIQLGMLIMKRVCSSLMHMSISATWLVRVRVRVGVRGRGYGPGVRVRVSQG